MARVVFALALVALFAAVAVATKDPPKDAKFVQVTLSIDNSPAEVKKAQAVIEKELAKNICKQGKPTFVSIKDTSGGLNGKHQTQLVFNCPGKNPPKSLEEIMDDCGDSLTNVHELKDEVKDDTRPDIEIEDVKCVYGPVKGGVSLPEQAGSAVGGAASAATGAVTGAASTAGSAVTGAASTFGSAVTGAANSVTKAVTGSAASLTFSAAAVLAPAALIMAML